MPKSKKKKNNTIVIIGLLLFLVFLFLLGGAFWYQKNSKPVEKNLESAIVRLKWLHQTQFAGHYVADQKGYYADNGLDVELNPFDFESFPIDDVVSGKADFGVTGATELLIARSKGKPVKAVAVIYQQNPVTAYTLKESGIDTPDDFVGKTVGVQTGVNVEFQIRAMLAAVGVDYDSEINVVPLGFDTSDLVDGKIDVATGYLTNEPVQVENKGYDINLIYPGDYQVNLYADVLFTTDEMIENRPDYVKRFVKATLDGWDYALAHHDEAVLDTLKYEDPNNNALTYEHQKQLLEKSEPLIKPNRGTKVGEMDFIRWKRVYDLMKEYDILKGDMDVTDAYVTDFLKNR